jgi:hypothetical protein
MATQSKGWERKVSGLRGIKPYDSGTAKDSPVPERLKNERGTPRQSLRMVIEPLLRFVSFALLSVFSVSTEERETE